MNFDATYEKRIRSIRGATTVGQNTSNDIISASVELYREMLKKNQSAEIDEIINVVISTTSDITAAYPAKAIREDGCTAPLFSCLEPAIDGALPMCIRVLMTVYSVNPVRHVYMRNASGLRPDIK